VAHWKCPKAHPYAMSIGDRTRGRGCRTCPSPAKQNRTLTIARPDLAQELHPTANFPRTADDITIGSRLEATWQCPSGHTYKQRAERRNAGYGCNICTGREFAPGINDFQTLQPEISSEWHPTKNGAIEPRDRIQKSREFWWKCLDAKHEMKQSFASRIQSMGCPNCVADDRVTQVVRK
jgi:hypothetical protein